MRKYIVFVATLILFFFFALSQAHITLAQVVRDGTAAIGDACSGDGPMGLSPGLANRICKPGLHCASVGGIFSLNRCAADAPLKCSCKNPDKPSNGDGTNEIQCQGVSGSPIYCANNNTCTTAADTTASANNMVDLQGQGDSAYKDKSITGVSCTPNKSVTKCKCNGTNTFECDIDGKTEKGTGKCKVDGAICANADPNASTDTKTTDNYGGGFGSGIGAGTGFDIKGITCEPPKAECTCEHPGTAANGQNGFNCTLNGQTVHDFCAHENMACTPAAGSSMKAGDGSKSQPFNGATLNGIKCSNPSAELSPAPPQPPPPSPPCLTWTGEGQCTAFRSAFGELATDPGGFVRTLFAVLLSFSGGIALLLIIRAGYKLLVSQGKPEQINQARDELVAAIVGLVFLIFSFVVLQTIGVDILHLPGFGGS